MKKMIVGVFFGVGLMTHVLHSMENKQVALNQFIEYYANITTRLFKQAPKHIDHMAPGLCATLVLKDWNDCQICEILNNNIIPQYENCGWLIDTFDNGSLGSQHGIRVWYSHKESLYSYEKLKEAYTKIIFCLKHSWEGVGESKKPGYYLMRKEKSLSLYKEQSLIELMIKKLGWKDTVIGWDDETTFCLWMKKDVASELFRVFFR